VSRRLSYQWGLAVTCLAFEIAGLIYAFTKPVASAQSPLIFPIGLAGLFVAWMLFTNFVMQRLFAQGTPMNAARLGWYWAFVGGIACAIPGWHSLTKFSSDLLAGYVTLYAMLFLFVCWVFSCYAGYAEEKRRGRT